MSSSTYRGALYRWLERCEVRDEHGRPVHLTPHQWRHTLGTRLINKDVPQEVVRRILDHDSPQMTAHYANPRELHQMGGLCPGNNESAGKKFSGRTRNGNAWLCGMLGDCATAAARSKNTYLAERHRRIQRRRGRKRAKVAISRSILESAWWIMTRGVDYQDLGPEHFITRPNPERRAYRLAFELRALGHEVTLAPPVPDQSVSP